MKTQFLVITAVVVAGLLALNPIKILSLEDASLFFTVIGVTYGVMSAFAINDVDKALDELRDSFGQEVSSLKAIYLLSKRLSDKVIFKKICSGIIEYCKETIALDLSAYGKGTKAHRKFHYLLGLLSSIKIKGARDNAIFSSIIEETRTALTARDMQITLANDRLPRMQWVLEIFLSLILIIILTTVSTPGGYIYMFVIAMMMFAILLTLVAIYELDSMRDFEDEISNAPYRNLIALIKEEGI
jgi:hypothetical protein